MFLVLFAEQQNILNKPTAFGVPLGVLLLIVWVMQQMRQQSQQNTDQISRSIRSNSSHSSPTTSGSTSEVPCDWCGTLNWPWKTSCKKCGAAPRKITPIALTSQSRSQSPPYGRPPTVPLREGYLPTPIDAHSSRPPLPPVPALPSQNTLGDLGIAQCPACGGRLVGTFRKCVHCAADLAWVAICPHLCGKYFMNANEQLNRCPNCNRGFSEPLHYCVAEKGNELEVARTLYAEQKRTNQILAAAARISPGTAKHCKSCGTRVMQSELQDGKCRLCSSLPPRAV